MRTTDLPDRLEIAQSVRMPLPRAGGDSARLISFAGLPRGQEHVALALGPVPVARPLVRIHSECLTGDVFGSLRCDCGAQLDEAIGRIAIAGGYVLYLRQEGRGIGLAAKIHAYALQDRGLDTYEANAALGLPDDARDFSIAARMLAALGVRALTLLTNNADKTAALRAAGLDVETIATGRFGNVHNAAYFEAKRARGHTL